MDCPKKSNKISDIVRLRQILKKWKKAANSNPNPNSSSPSSPSSGGSKSTSAPIKFIKRTLSFTDMSVSNCSTSNESAVPKGFLAVCVGEEMKRFVIPMEYLRHQAFGRLLREAEEEFGFQQQGVLKIPCQVSVFERILKNVQENKDHEEDDEGDSCFFHEFVDKEIHVSSNSHVHPQLCR
ncbi:SAUR-like auxin-responsive protein family [Euphorbia peplus]|nr:SAUR-like auxin-responsive protein family [Euphorbia peplus]